MIRTRMVLYVEDMHGMILSKNVERAYQDEQ